MCVLLHNSTLYIQRSAQQDPTDRVVPVTRIELFVQVVGLARKARRLLGPYCFLALLCALKYCT
jgi:hypothetical protein